MKWLTQNMIPGPRLVLVLNEEDFHAALDELPAPKEGRPLWISDGAGACMHALRGEEIACIVVLQDSENTASAIGLLVHEAVHVFQAWCEDVGEKEPSSEFQAYAIQSITERLIASFNEQQGSQA